MINFDDLEITNNLMIVDSLNLSFRWKKNITGWSHKLVSTINSLANSYNAREVIVLGDGGSTYRKDIYPEYKGNRNKEDQTEEEKQEWADFFNEYELALEEVKHTYPILKFKGVEADDIAAYLVQNLTKEFEHIWLISSDRDWDLLVNDNVSRFSIFGKKEYTKENWDEHYPYNIENHIDVKVLAGDMGDNIPGVSGIGPTRAKTLLDKYGPTSMDIMDNLPIKGTAKYIQELNKFGDKILLNYELMDLVTYCETAIQEHKSKIDLYIKHIKGELASLPEIYESMYDRKERLS